MAGTRRKRLLGLLCVITVSMLLLYYHYHKEQLYTSVTKSRSNEFVSGLSLAIIVKEDQLSRAKEIFQMANRHHHEPDEEEEQVAPKKVSLLNTEKDTNPELDTEDIDIVSNSPAKEFNNKEIPQKDYLDNMTIARTDSTVGNSDSIEVVEVNSSVEELSEGTPLVVQEVDSFSEQDESLPSEEFVNKVTDDHPQTLTPCTKIGGSPNNKGWNSFTKLLEKYARYHKEQMNKLKGDDEGSKSVRTLTYACNDPSICSGLGDQIYRIQQALLLAVASDRVLILHWDETSMKTFHHLLPNRIKWNFFNKSTGIRLSPDNIVKHFKRREDYVRFMTELESNERIHITMGSALPVPLGKGLSRLIGADKRKIFSKVALYSMINGKKKNFRVSLSSLSGYLLRYLFTFSQDVLEKVDQAQKKIGIFETPYVGVHIRTGFFGTEFEEVGHFNRMKIFRTEDTWESTMNCSVRLANESLSQTAPIYLATDSYMVKQLAANGYGKRIRSVNMTLQHVALLKDSHTDKHTANGESSNMTYSSEVQAISNLSGVDGYMATWIDLLLLARSDILVHSISGFSTVAGQFCSVKTQFYTPRCTKKP